ncbi:MAG: MAPEG family protein [Polyangiales bacterium]
MSPSVLALVGYVAWTILLVTTILLYRTVLVLKKERAANDFLPSGEDVSPFSNRLCRAHANCYENLPIFAALILLALVTDNAGITDSLARWVLVARVAQSTVHLISTSEMAVSLRAGLLLVQLGIEAYWVVQLGLLGFS